MAANKQQEVALPAIKRCYGCGRNRDAVNNSSIPTCEKPEKFAQCLRRTLGLIDPQQDPKHVDEPVTQAGEVQKDDISTGIKPHITLKNTSEASEPGPPQEHQPTTGDEARTSASEIVTPPPIAPGDAAAQQPSPTSKGVTQTSGDAVKEPGAGTSPARAPEALGNLPAHVLGSLRTVPEHVLRDLRGAPEHVLNWVGTVVNELEHKRGEIEDKHAEIGALNAHLNDVSKARDQAQQQAYQSKQVVAQQKADADSHGDLARRVENELQVAKTEAARLRSLLDKRPAPDPSALADGAAAAESVAEALSAARARSRRMLGFGAGGGTLVGAIVSALITHHATAPSSHIEALIDAAQICLKEDQRSCALDAIQAAAGEGASDPRVAEMLKDPQIIDEAKWRLGAQRTLEEQQRQLLRNIQQEQQMLDQLRREREKVKKQDGDDEGSTGNSHENAAVASGSVAAGGRSARIASPKKHPRSAPDASAASAIAAAELAAQKLESAKVFLAKKDFAHAVQAARDAQLLDPANPAVDDVLKEAIKLKAEKETTIN